MTDNVSCQPKGVPVGGQFAATNHSEPDVSLTPISAAPPLSLQDLVAQRDATRERWERIFEQKDLLDQQRQAQSVRVLGAGLLEKYPNAAPFRISENVDGENNFYAVSLTDANGSVIESADDDDAWIYEEIGGTNGPYVEELVFELDPKDNRWADKIGRISGGGKRDFKTVDIDLVAARDAPLPPFPEIDAPYTKPLNEDEQKVLVNMAHQGVFELEDKLGERAGDYGPADLDAMQAQLDPARKILSPPGY